MIVKFKMSADFFFGFMARSHPPLRRAAAKGSGGGELAAFVFVVVVVVLTPLFLLSACASSLGCSCGSCARRSAARGTLDRRCGPPWGPPRARKVPGSSRYGTALLLL